MAEGETTLSGSTPRQPRAARWIVGACLVVLFAFPVQALPCGTQASHYALVRAFGDRTARIDDDQWMTCDKAWFDGHSYSVKAPGLAAMAQPGYEVLHHFEIIPADGQWAVWLLSLTTVIPLAILLVWLVGRVAGELVPDHERFTIATVAVGSLILPFATLWFGHVPGATLAFAAYVLIRPGVEVVTPWRAVAAGLLAGGAVLFEYPTFLIAATLVVFVALTRGLRSVGWMCAGGAVPAALLLLYNHWAFGSVTHFSYENAVTETGETGHDVLGANDQGFFGIGWPSAHAFVDLIASPRGLLVVTPICALAVAGIVLRYGDSRPEALLLGGLTALFLVYNSGYTLSFGGPFGGDAPGPRFLVAVLPFLLLPVGLAATRLPGMAITLLVISGATMLLATATGPLVSEGFADTWPERLKAGDFVDTPVTRLTGNSGWLEILPFFLAGGVILGLGLVRPVRGALGMPARAALEAGIVLLIWLALYTTAHAVYSDNVSAPAYPNPRSAASTSAGSVSRL